MLSYAGRSERYYILDLSGSTSYTRRLHLWGKTFEYTSPAEKSVFAIMLLFFVILSNGSVLHQDGRGSGQSDEFRGNMIRTPTAQ